MRNAPNEELVAFYQNNFKGPINLNDNIQGATNPQKNFGNKAKWQQTIEKMDQQHFDWVQSRLAFEKRIYPGRDRVFAYHYQFGKELTRQHHFQKSVFSKQKQQKERKMSQQLNKISFYEKDFNIHYVNQKYIQLKNVENKMKKRRLSLRDIHLIGQKDYQIILDQTDIGSQIVQLHKNKVEKKPHEDDSLINQLVKFHMYTYHPKVGNCITSTLGSEEFGINFYKDMSIVQELSIESVPLDGNQMDYKRTLEIAKGGFTKSQLLKLQKQHKLNLLTTKMLENDLHIEQRVKELKAKIRHYIQLKQQKKKRETVSAFTQTDNQKTLVDSILQMDFDVDPILFKIQTLIDIKSNHLKSKAPGIVVNQIHNKINNQLFNLLCIVSHGQTHVSIDKIMMIQSRDLVEYELVKILFQNMDEMEGKIYKRGQSKASMLNFYLNMKIKLEDEGGPKFLRTKQVQEIQKEENQKRKKTIKAVKPLDFFEVNQNRQTKQNIALKPIETPKKRLNGSFKFNRNTTPKGNKQATPQTRLFNNSSFNASRNFTSKNNTLRQVSPFLRTPKRDNKSSFENTIQKLFQSKKSPVKTKMLTPPKLWK